jgi:hypothetical protein
LAELLLKLQSKGYSGACWGYNFDWQSKAFFLPKYTPTIVATSFVVEALLNAYEITKDKQYLNTAISSGDFVLKDLNRVGENNEFMFSYSPLDKRAVYNASLLGTKTLSLLYSYTKKEEYKNIAFITAKSVCNLQNEDGSFPHSDQVGNKWRDNFHTGFKLESIAYYQKFCEDDLLNENLRKGFEYWVNNYFEQSGKALYYDRRMGNIIDLHCAAQAITTFCKLDMFDEYESLVDKIVTWTIDNMFCEQKGYFYFQMKTNNLNKTEYMRWPNAWMFYGLSYYLSEKYCG